VLIVGGRRGARALNEAVPEALNHLLKIQVDLGLSVWHQTGPADESMVQKSYQQLQTVANSIKVTAYIEEVKDAYHWADIIVCRAGAMTVSELSAAALPGIFVPYPHHADDQQTLNAKFLVDAGAGVLMPQSELTSDALATTLKQLSSSPEILTNMSTAAQALHKPDAAIVVADALQEAAS